MGKDFFVFILCKLKEKIDFFIKSHILLDITMSTNNNQNINSRYNLRTKRAIPKKVIEEPEEQAPKHAPVSEVDLSLGAYSPYTEGFKGYVWSLLRPTGCGWTPVDVKTGYDDTQKKITDITFNIGRWGKIKKTLRFNSPVTEKEAILAVTKWLLKPMSYNYYHVLAECNDLAHGLTWDKNFRGQKRGMALGDAIFLEVIKYKDSHCTIWCGS